MIVRELITKLGFSVDDSGMRKAEAGVDRIKKQAEYAAQALMGVGAALAGFVSRHSQSFTKSMTCPVVHWPSSSSALVGVTTAV